MQDDCLAFFDGRLKLSVDADGMAFVQTVTRIPLDHLRQVIVGIYSTFIRSELGRTPLPTGEVCEVTPQECSE